MDISKAIAIGQQRAMAIRHAQVSGIAIPENRMFGELNATSKNKDAKNDAQSDRKKVGELVGSIFYDTLIKQMQSSGLKSNLFHGGRGEEAFNGQLAGELSSRIGRSKQEPVSNAIYRAMRHKR